MSIRALNTGAQAGTEVVVKQTVVNSVSVHVSLSRSFTLTQTHSGLWGHDWSENPVTLGRFSTRFNCYPSAPVVHQSIKLKPGAHNQLDFLEEEEERRGRDRSDKSRGRGREGQHGVSALRLHPTATTGHSVHPANHTDLGLKGRG